MSNIIIITTTVVIVQVIINLIKLYYDENCSIKTEIENLYVTENYIIVKLFIFNKFKKAIPIKNIELLKGKNKIMIERDMALFSLLPLRLLNEYSICDAETLSDKDKETYYDLSSLLGDYGFTKKYYKNEEILHLNGRCSERKYLLYRLSHQEKLKNLKLHIKTPDINKKIYLKCPNIEYFLWYIL